MEPLARYADGTEVRKGDAAVLAEGLTPALVLEIFDSNPPGVMFEDAEGGGQHMFQPLEDQLIFVERDSSDYRAAALAWLRREAQAGDSTAQSALGWLHASGTLVPKDESLACHWFLKAAEAGEPTAQYGLACRYEQGHGIATDLAEAVRWYMAAAKQGIAPAVCNLADKYERGAGVRQDLALAFDMYRMAAENRVVMAMVGLANLYRDGRGTAQDEAQAKQWMARARDAGYRG
jgi:TPR repeat protein